MTAGAGSGYRTDGFGPTYAAPLLKVGARYYDPQFGCFLTRDTLLDQKPYGYCDGDPINFADSNGHERYVAPGKPANSEDYEAMGHLGNVIILSGGVVAVFCPPAGGVIILLGSVPALAGEIAALTKPPKKEKPEPGRPDPKEPVKKYGGTYYKGSGSSNSAIWN